MLKIFLLSLIVILIGLALMGIKLYFGKPFVHTHIDGNKALNKQGIHCVQSMDRRMRRPKRHAVREKSENSKS